MCTFSLIFPNTSSLVIFAVHVILKKMRKSSIFQKDNDTNIQQELHCKDLDQSILTC